MHLEYLQHDQTDDYQQNATQLPDQVLLIGKHAAEPGGRQPQSDENDGKTENKEQCVQQCLFLKNSPPLFTSSTVTPVT